MAVSPSRIGALKKVRRAISPYDIIETDSPQLQATLFGHSYNPLNIRTGNKVLRQRLRGPTVASYYPARVWSIKDMTRLFPQWETYDDREAERADKIAIQKARGKGPPKKKRTAEESKKASKSPSKVNKKKPVKVSGTDPNVINFGRSLSQ